MAHWAAAVRKDAPPPAPPSTAAINEALQTAAPLSNSALGVTTMVVDTNAFIEGIDLSGLPYQLCTIREVVNEVRDPRDRAKMESLPVPLKCIEPLPDSLTAVTQFAKATGDYHVLSATDLKVIALAHTLEVQSHGSEHIRTQPPPLVRSSATQRQADPPGWGANIKNPEEWEQLPDDDGDDGQHGNAESRILGVKSLQENVTEEAEADADEVDEEAELREQEARKARIANKRVEKVKLLMEQKRNVCYGIRASNDDGENDEWEKAGCRSTRKKHKKKAAAAAAAAASVVAATAASDEPPPLLDASDDLDVCGESSDAESNGESSIDTSQEEARLQNLHLKECEGDHQSLPRSTSNIACMTSDFAMQNVILQMGLRLFTPNGGQVKMLQRWMLKCQACGNVTREVGRIFCPKCGNGGTLYRVSCVTGADGSVLSGSQRRVSIRGTRYSLPLPKGGREGTLMNPVLREDQLTHKFRNKKKAAKPGLDMINSFDDVFGKEDKRMNQSAALRNTIAVLSGRKNPNDQHFTKNRV